MTLELRQRLLGTTLLAGAVLIAAPAAAQTQNPQEPADANQTTSPVQGTVAPTTSADSSRKPVEDIVITGSRIPQPNLTSTSPVTVVSAQEVKLQGTTRVEDLLNSLPQVFANEGSTDSNGSSGIATVDLRDLGPKRTLVLVNGRRVVPGDAEDPVTDLNFIPASLIKRVDVLTGGASSVYGSDALAGVVNFIMDTTFTGVRLDAQGTFYQHNNDVSSTVTDAMVARNFGFPKGNVIDGGIQSVTASIGASLGDDRRGHVMAYAGFRNQSAVFQADRDFSSCALFGSMDAGYSCSGSSTGMPGRFMRTVFLGLASGLPIYGPDSPSSYSIDPATGEFRPYKGSRDAFNYNPYNYFQRPDERYTLGAFADYEISPGFQPYIEAMFMDDRSKSQIAPSGAFFGTDFFVNCANPFMTADQAATLCGAAGPIDPATGLPTTGAGSNTIQSFYLGRRNTEGGGRVEDLRHTDYRVVAGMKGDIVRGVTYDVYAMGARAIMQKTYLNDFSRVRLNRSLDVVNALPDGTIVPVGTPGSAPICRSALPDANLQVVDPNCVPYNVFQMGGVTPQALTYLQTPGLKNGQTGEYTLSGSVTMALGEYGFQSPWANEGIGIALGGEYRRNTLELRHDVEYLTGDLAGQGTPLGVNDASGQVTVKEVFGEARIPLVSDRPFFKDLNVELGFRHSKYSTAGSTDAYKIAGEWAPSADGKIRAGYNRAVRAPNILELFTPPTVGLFSPSIGDPCSDGLVAGSTTQLVGGSTVAQCLNTFDSSFTQAQALALLTQPGGVGSNPAGQYNQRGSGNPNLAPEVGDSYTAGIVLTPRFIPRFSASVDYYNIKIRKVISSYGAEFILAQCLATADPKFCTLIHRSPGSGSLFTGPSFVDNPGFNLGSMQTRGIDVNASYRFPLPFSGNTMLSLDLVGTYLMDFKVQPDPASNGRYDCAGFFGGTCGTPLPEWRHKLRATVALNKNLSVSGAWRYMSAVKNDLDSSNPLMGGGPGTAAANELTPRINAVSYFDLAMAASFDHLTWRIGANNILDKTPPVLSLFYTSNGSNTFAQVYDSLGRYIYSSVTLDF